MNRNGRTFVMCCVFGGVCLVAFISRIQNREIDFNDQILKPLPMETEYVTLKLTSQNVEQIAKPKILLQSETTPQNCSEKKVKLSPHSLPITGLASFPGAGNTWTRHLIQQMSGLGTSSCYCDAGLKMKGFPFECHHDKSKTLVVKSHENRHFKRFKFQKVVLLIRNPYDALMAYANYARAGHTGRPSKTVLIQASNKMFNNSLRWFVNLTNRTIHNFDGPVHIVQYEKLKTDTSNTLRKLAEFLHVNITQRDIDCTVKLQEGNFHRKTSEKEHLQLLKEVYDKDKLLQMKEAADKTEELIKEAYGIDIDVGGPIEPLLFTDR